MAKRVKSALRRLPFIYPAAQRLREQIEQQTFVGSAQYWEQRYGAQGDSGGGSYHHLSEFKAQVINDFVQAQAIQSVIEFGCGDGNQLRLGRYPAYVGLDVSVHAIKSCQRLFADDPTKSFYLYHPEAFHDRQGLFTADLSLSLDVIYHLVEDAVFESYMRHLLASARRFAILYSSNYDAAQTVPHVRHRHFTRWIEGHADGWHLMDHIENQYPYSPEHPTGTSFAEFYIYRRCDAPPDVD